MLSIGNIPPEIPADLYRWFLAAYSVSALSRMALAGYQQMVVLGTGWYDVPVAVFATLEHGFIPHVVLSLAAAEVLNMVFGALMKIKARDQGRAQGREEANKEWLDWLRRKTEAEAKGEEFTDPSPADNSTLNGNSPKS